MADFLLLLGIGFLAQLVDGALGSVNAAAFFVAIAAATTFFIELAPRRCGT